MQTNLNDINGGGNGTWGFAPLFPPGDALLPTALFFCGYPPTRPFRAPLKELAIDIQIRSSRVAFNLNGRGTKIGFVPCGAEPWISGQSTLYPTPSDCYGRGILTTSSKVSPAVAKQIHRGVVQRVKGGGAYAAGARSVRKKTARAAGTDVATSRKAGGAYELGGTRSEWLDSIDNHGGLTLVAKNGHHPDLGGLGLMSDLHLSTQPPSF